MHIFLHALPFIYVNMTISTEYKLSELQVRISEENKLNTVHNCKNIRLRNKTGEWNTFVIASEQFATAKSGCAGVLWHTSSRA